MNEIVHLPHFDEQRGSTQNSGLTPNLDASISDELNFSTIKSKLTFLINEWEHFREKAKENRKTRDVEFSCEVLRREGVLDEDETMVPVRIIDTNITRELPPYVNYIKNSRRLCIFTPQDDPTVATDKLEIEFTKGMTYLNWEKAHFKVLDGSATHGWDTAEVVFDASKPLHASVEHVGFDNLFWPRTIKDIQQSPRVIRAYDFSLIELKTFVKKFGWNESQVNLIINARKDGKKAGETSKIYKQMAKLDGIVFVSWFSDGDGTSDWLKAPEPLYLGIDEQDQQSGQWTPSQETEYPYYRLPYRETEKPKLVDNHGRVFLDGPKQEAQTGVLSSFINGVARATKIMASPAEDDGSGNSVKEIADHPLDGGVILSKPMQFYNSPYPDFEILKALQYMDTANSQETNQTNFAVMNREDSRKTAKEMSLAEQQGNLLNSVQLTLFSTYFRGVYSRVWKIVQSQALQGLITFLIVNKPQPIIGVDGTPALDPQTHQPVMQPNWVNDTDTIKHTFDVRAAGDVDVIQKQELIQQMKQDWPVIQNTALSMPFLCDLVRLSYPDKGEQYANILQQGQANEVKTLGALASGLTTVLVAMMKNHPEIIQKLAPQDQQKLAQMIQAGEQVKQQVGGGQAQPQAQQK